MKNPIRHWPAGLAAAVLCTGCGSDGDAAGSVTTGPGQMTAAPAPEIPPPTFDAPADANAGLVTFTIGGNTLQFDALPSGHNYYTQLASQVTARPRVDAAEQLSITFASIDLRKQEYPAELPRPRAGGTPMDPLAAMAQVGFSYRNEAGQEWAGPGRIQLTRYDRNGILAGRFSDVVLPHTDRTLPEITLTGGEFQVQISPAW